MEIKNLILIIIATINFILGVLILSKNSKKGKNIWFAMIMIGASLWSIGLAFSREYAGSQIAISWSRSTYLSSLLIGLSLLNFSLLFPYKLKINNITKALVWLPFVCLFSVMLVKEDFIIKTLTAMPWGYDNVYSYGYLVFSAVFVFYLIWAFVNLIKKYAASEGVIKIQLKWIILGLSLAAVFGTIFDLILPYLGYWKLNWLGPYFTIFVLFSISYLIFYKSNKQY